MGLLLEYQYFTVREQPRLPCRMTSTYYVVNRRSGTTIGLIRWYGPWRAFCFFPEANTVWSCGCLADLHEALETIAQKHKEEGEGT